MSITTRAIVTIVVEVEVSESWHDEEPMLRPLKEAKEKAMRQVREAITSDTGEPRKMRLVSINETRIYVSERK